MLIGGRKIEMGENMPRNQKKKQEASSEHF